MLFYAFAQHENITIHVVSVFYKELLSRIPTCYTIYIYRYYSAGIFSVESFNRELVISLVVVLNDTLHMTFYCTASSIA